MNTRDAIKFIQEELRRVFATLDEWFDEPESIKEYTPVNGGWAVGQILEHVALTNHYLLILIRKGRDGALLKAGRGDLQETMTGYLFGEARLREIGVPGSFAWHRPDHMEPRGDIAPGKVRELLKAQLAECLEVLAALSNGEGALYKTTMTVNGLGKLDVYEYLYFLAAHGKRHLAQMERVKSEYRDAS